MLVHFFVFFSFLTNLFFLWAAFFFSFRSCSIITCLRRFSRTFCSCSLVFVFFVNIQSMIGTLPRSPSSLRCMLAAIHPLFPKIQSDISRELFFLINVFVSSGKRARSAAQHFCRRAKYWRSSSTTRCLRISSTSALSSPWISLLRKYH